MQHQLVNWAPTAFVLAGVLLLVTVAYGSLGWMLGLFEVVWQVVAVGFVVTVFTVVAALLGVYPELRSQAPRLARLGAGLVFVTAFGALNLMVIAVGELLGWEAPEAYGNAVFMGIILGLPAALMVFGIAAWRTRTFPRLLGALLTVAGLVILVPLSDGVFQWGPPPEWLPIAITAVWAVIFLRAGVLLRTGKPAEPRPPAPVKVP